MNRPIPTLEYATPPKRVRFLEKLNPDATPRSMARRAVRNAAIAAASLLPARHYVRDFDLPWLLFAMAVVLAAGVGVVLEWQEPEE
jgi:hypothetical protein